MIVTLWYRDTGTGREYNHMSPGYSDDCYTPSYVTEEQRLAWRNSIWVPQKSKLINGRIV